MKTLLCVCAALVLALAAVSARAADVTGTWTATMSTPNGDFQLSFTFKQDGTTVTGSVLGPQGDQLTFKVSFNGMTINHDGTISPSGDEIKLSTKADSGDFPANEMTLKRAKPAAPAPAPSPQQ